jgi:hypothetical protein
MDTKLAKFCHLMRLTPLGSLLFQCHLQTALNREDVNELSVDVYVRQYVEYVRQRMYYLYGKKLEVTWFM